MTTAADSIEEAQFKLREIARPMWTDTRQGSLGRAARKLGISASLAERIVYRKLKRIDAHVLDNIRAAYVSIEARAERIADERQQIETTLRRELEGRTYAAADDNSRGHSELAREPAGPQGKKTLGEG